MTQPNNTPQELADLIDSLMAGGSGHVNIKSDDSDSGMNVVVFKSSDICGNKGACCQPTENIEDED